MRWLQDLLADDRNADDQTEEVIPRLSDQNPCTQSRRPMDMMVQGCATQLVPGLAAVIDQIVVAGEDAVGEMG